MNKVDNALHRLSSILPLKQRLDDLEAGPADIYLTILNEFNLAGRAPTVEELSQETPEIQSVLQSLAELDMITLDDQGEIKGCYPFTMEKREHRIQLNGNEVHAMCALDALAPSSMFDSESTVQSECAVTKEPVSIQLKGDQVLNNDEAGDIHFGINWAAASSCCSCSDSLCTEMLFLKDAGTADSWLAEDPEQREIFDLPSAIEFSAGFFKPMLAQG